MVNNATNLELNEPIEKQFADSNSIIKNSTEENSNVNCFALTIIENYSLSISKNVFFKTWRTTWRVALSVFILNFLTFFF